MLRRPVLARRAQRSPLVGVVVVLGFAASGACAYPVEDFTSESLEAGSVDAPPLTDPRPDSAGASDDVVSTSSSSSADPAGGSSGSNGSNGSDGDHGHGKKKGGDQ